MKQIKIWPSWITGASLIIQLIAANIDLKHGSIGFLPLHFLVSVSGRIHRMHIP
jgi:hypothetical protein